MHISILNNMSFVQQRLLQRLFDLRPAANPGASVVLHTPLVSGGQLVSDGQFAFSDPNYASTVFGPVSASASIGSVRSSSTPGSIIGRTSRFLKGNVGFKSPYLNANVEKKLPLSLPTLNF